MAATRAPESLERDVLRILARAVYRLRVYENFLDQLYHHAKSSNAFRLVERDLRFRSLDINSISRLQREECATYIAHDSLEERAAEVTSHLTSLVDGQHLLEHFLVDRTLITQYLRSKGDLDPLPEIRALPYGIFIALPPEIYDEFLVEHGLQDAPLVSLPPELIANNASSYMAKKDDLDRVCYIIPEKGNLFDAIQLGVALTSQRDISLLYPGTPRMPTSQRKQRRNVLQSELTLFNIFNAYVMVYGKCSLDQLMANIPETEGGIEDRLRSYFTQEVIKGTEHKTLPTELVDYIAQISAAIPSVLTEVNASRYSPKIKGIVLFDDPTFISQQSHYSERVGAVARALRSQDFREIKEYLQAQESIF